MEAFEGRTDQGMEVIGMGDKTLEALGMKHSREVTLRRGMAVGVVVGDALMQLLRFGLGKRSPRKATRCSLLSAQDT